MTDKEKAIVMAHTGICMLTGNKFQIFYKYVEDIMGRPIMTHEIGLLANTIKEKSKDDFIALCKAELKEEFEREIEIANKDIDLMPEQEDYMRGYLGGILCAYRIVFGKNYEESEEENLTLDDWTYGEYPRESEEEE